MIPYKNRFHGHNSLSYVYQNGKAIRERLITLKYSHNKHRDDPRFAVVVSKKVLKSAVRRNRMRRRIYELIQKKSSSLNGVYDMVFIVTSAELLGTSHEELQAILDKLFQQAKVEKS
jgi:ribonuclease P protein component